MEPEAIKMMTSSDKSSDMVGLSIAISLRRIADALTYQAEAPENLFDHIRAARYAVEGMENRRG